MGASDLHTVMAAGLAGGIGLSGSTCGALGAAIWIAEMNGGQEDMGTIQYNSSRAREVIARFKQSTGTRFECSDIVGQKFEGIGDHVRYLRAGSCSELIKALAAA